MIRLSALVLYLSAATAFAQNVGIASVTPGIVTEFAGYSTAGCTANPKTPPYDGCPPANINLSGIHAAIFDAAGNLYLADNNNHRIRKISASGAVTTIAGNGTFNNTAGVSGSAIGDNGPATSAVVTQPSSIAVDASGNVYFADYIANRVRVVYFGGANVAALIAIENPGVTATPGYIYTIAGTGTYPSVAPPTLTDAMLGDGGLATSALFSNSSNVSSSNGLNGLALDAAGNIYVDDDTNDVVRKISVTTGIISLYAGQVGASTGTFTNGLAATANPIGLDRGLAINAAGDLFIAGSNTYMVNGPNTTAITPGLGFGYGPGTIHIVAGGGGVSGVAGPYNTLGTLTRFGSPRQISLDPAGDLYNNDATFLRITKLDVTDTFTLVAGNSAQTSGTFTAAKPPLGLGGPAILAQLGTPVEGVISPLTGDLYIPDSTNNVIYDVSASSSALQFNSQSTYLTSPAQSAVVSNISTGVLHLSGLTFSAPIPFTQVPSGKTDCTPATVLQPGQSCWISVVFTPVAATAASGTITITDDSTGIPGSTQTISLTGTGTTTASASTLSVSPGVATVGSPVTLKATVTSSTGSPITYPTGTVTFLNSGVVLGTGTLNPTGIATFTTSSLGLGNYNNLTASYSGDTVYTASNSSAASLSVVSTIATSTSLSVSSQTIPVGGTETLSAMVTATSGTPAGTVTFYSGSTSLGSGSLNGSGVATFTTSTLAAGYNPITAIYAGNATFTASSSGAVSVQVTASALPVAALIPGIINGLAGTSGTSGSTGDGGNATAALFNGPTHAALDTSGNLYIADSGNNTVRKVAATSGAITSASTISLLAGSEGVPGAAVGSGTATRFQSPQGIAFDASGNLYIADSQNNAIRKITATAGAISSSSTVSSYAGSQTTLGSGYTGAAFTAAYTGDGGAALSATLNNPRDVAIDRLGNLFILDYGNNVIRMVNGSGTTATTPGLGFGYGPGVIHTVAGSGRVTSSTYSMGDGGLATAATFNAITGIAVDLNGNLYISDSGNSVVRKVAASNAVITTYAGTAGVSGNSGDSGLATAARLGTPASLSFDIAGDLYIADSTNQAVREVNTAGIILTVAGSGIRGSQGNGGASTLATLNTPAQAVPDGQGNLYLVESAANTVRQINGQASALSFPAQAEGTTSAPQTVLVSNPGGQPLALSGLVSSSAVFAQSTSGTGNCTATGTVAPGTDCALVITATSPSTVSANITSTGSFTTTDNSLNKSGSQQIISLSLITDDVLSQSITFPTVPPPTYGSAPIQLQATATSGLPVTYTVLNGPGTITGSMLTITGAGTIFVQASQAGQTLVYFAAPNVMQSIVVSPANLTVTANNLSQSTGIAIQPLTYTVQGFVNGDTAASSVTGSPVLTTTATTTSPNGTYPIAVALGTLAATNYSFTLVPGTLTLAGAPQFITFNPLSAVTYSNTPVVLSATSTSGLPITYAVLSGPATVSGSTLTTLGAGTVVIQANQAGNYNATTNATGYGQAVPIQQTLLVNPAPLTVVVANISRMYGTPNPTFTSTVTGAVGSDTLTVTYSTAGTPVSVPSSYPINPTVTGTKIASYQLLATPGVLTVTTANPTVLLSTSSTSVLAGKSIALTATVSSVTGVGLTPTGTVSFYAGALLLATSNLSGAGTAILTTTALPAGLQSVTAIYNGDSNYAVLPSNAIAVNVQSTTTVTIATSATTANLGIPVTFTVTITSSTISNTIPTGTVTFFNGTTALGTVKVTANGFASGVPSAIATFTTSSLPLTSEATYPSSVPGVTVPANYNAYYTTADAPVPLAITAVYSGDSLFLGGTTGASVAETITPQFSIYLMTQSPTTGHVTASNEGVVTYSGTTTNFAGYGSVTITSGQQAQIQGALVGFNGYAQPVNLTCSGLPQYATCSFTQSAVAPNSIGAMFNVFISTAGLPQIVDSRRPPTFPGKGAKGTALAAVLLGLGCLFRCRKAFSSLHRAASRLAVVLLAVGSLVAVAGAVGCASGSIASSGQALVAPGTSVITVTGTTSTSTYNSTFTLVVH